MCIIIAKNKKDRLPTKEELKNSFNRNSDGAGFMYVDNGQVVVDKGYMTFDNFYKRFKELTARYNDFENKSLVIHMRIGTSGTNTKSNTHPYIITNRVDLLHKTYIKSDLGIAHNGVITDYTPTNTKQDINDTQLFIGTYLYGLYINYKEFYKNRYIRKGIEKITNSKFAILDKNDELYLIGDFIEEDGLSFSNTSYYGYVSKTYKYFGDYFEEEKEWNKAYADYYTRYENGYYE